MSWHCNKCWPMDCGCVLNMTKSHAGHIIYLCADGTTECLTCGEII